MMEMINSQRADSFNIHAFILISAHVDADADDGAESAAPPPPFPPPTKKGI